MCLDFFFSPFRNILQQLLHTLDYIQTFLECGKQCELFGESCLDKRSIGTFCGHQHSDYKEVIAELSPIMAVALSELVHKSISKLAVNLLKFFLKIT